MREVAAKAGMIDPEAPHCDCGEPITTVEVGETETESGYRLRWARCGKCGKLLSASPLKPR